MNERERSLVVTVILSLLIPALVAAMAVGGDRRDLRNKENIADHKADIQRLEQRDSAQYQLSLDILCAVKPRDRRCQ